MTLTDGREFMSAAALKTEAAEREGEEGEDAQPKKN
jgi:hypothetical protein